MTQDILERVVALERHHFDQPSNDDDLPPSESGDDYKSDDESMTIGLLRRSRK